MCRALLRLGLVALVMALISAPTGRAAGDPALVIYYSFDDFTDVVLDESGKGHDGVVDGDVTPWAEGKNRGAARFDGTSGPSGHSFIDLNGADFPEDDIPTSAITLAAWVKCQNTGGHHAIFNARASDATWLIHPEIRSNGEYRFLLRAAGSRRICDIRAGVVQWDEWVHYAGTYSTALGKAALYINGELVAEVDAEVNEDVAGDWRQGARIGYNIDNNRPFTGLMDEFRLYKRASSQSEIEALMQVVASPTLAYRPSPANGAGDVPPAVTLGWLAGEGAVSHDIYFGESFEDVNDSIAFVNNQTGTTYGPLDLELGKTYYWRIDEVAADATVTKGEVWAFTVAGYVLVDDFEDYNDYPPDRIFETWPGGYAAGDPANGSTVGHLEPPFAEQSIVHGGSQAMPFFYDNSGQANLSEAVANIDDLKSGRDWTVRGVKALSLWFRGHPAYFGSFVEGPAGTYTMTAGGYDIGGTSDEFHFAYKEVTGASTVIANVLSVGNTDPWAKAGVMIRDTLDADSAYVMVCVTPGNGVVMQYRNTTGTNAATATQQSPIIAPQWVKIERTLGGLVRGYYSADGVAWTQLASVSTVAMNTPMYVGLALTSHNENEMCVAQFSNVSFPNTSVEPQWDDRDVGIISNQAEPMYVAISNANGTPAVVYHEDANATLINTWTEWPIDLKKFADKGVNLADVDKMFIGFGTRENPQPGGNGTMYFDDIRLYVPRCVLDKVTPLAGDLTNDCRVDFADLQIMVNDWLQGDYTVPTAVPKDANLVLYYQFENNTVDSSGNAINGTPVGSPGYASGVFGQAIALDGSNYVNCGNPALLNFGRADWSICAWVKNAQADDTATVFANGGDESGGIRYTLGIGEAGPDGAVTITTDDDATKVQAVSTTTVNDNEWHHVCALRNGSELHVYVDGILDATNTVPTGYDLSGASQHNAYVGAITDHRDATGNTLEKFYIGLLDDLRIYDYALSDAELSYLATKGTSGLYFPLVSVANLYDAEPQNAKKVNFKDLAILAGQWLKEQLWPQP